MNISASNHSLENIVIRESKEKKRPTFASVFDKINRRSESMNRKTPLNNVLTNEQLFRYYLKEVAPRLNKSDDIFGEDEPSTLAELIASKSMNMSKLNKTSKSSSNNDDTDDKDTSNINNLIDLEPENSVDDNNNETGSYGTPSQGEVVSDIKAKEQSYAEEARGLFDDFDDFGDIERENPIMDDNMVGKLIQDNTQQEDNVERALIESGANIDDMPVKRKAGRPKGSKNKVSSEVSSLSDYLKAGRAVGQSLLSGSLPKNIAVRKMAGLTIDLEEVQKKLAASFTDNSFSPNTRFQALNKGDRYKTQRLQNMSRDTEGFV